MLEAPTMSYAAAVAGIAAVRGYAPPNRRNGSHGGGKSGGDLPERGNHYANDRQRNPIVATKSLPKDDGDASGSNSGGESLRAKLIPLHSCSHSEALQLLNNRWTAAVSAHETQPEGSADRPVLYTRKSPAAWNRAILPHLMVQPTAGASTGLQKDFLTELRQAIGDADSSVNPRRHVLT